MSYCDDYDDGCGVGPLEYKCQTCGGNLTVLFTSMVCDHCNPPAKPVPPVNEVYISSDSTAPLTLIDAHGPDHGLRVTYNFYDKSVLLEEWAEMCEPDENGSYSPHIHRAEIPLRTLMSRGLGLSSKGPSMRARVISAALAWMGYYGGTEEHVDDDDRPCQHFGMYYGPERDMPPGGWPGHMTCQTCGGKPTNDPY